MRRIRLINGDCLNELKNIQNDSINLIVTDPPYNMEKSKEWDKYKEDEYIEFMGKIFKESQRILTDNGQIYFFHNNIVTISRIITYLEENTNLIFSSFLIFPKPKFRRISWSNPTDSNKLRSWFNICEYALLYINGKSGESKWDNTGWDRVRLDVNNFASLRQYSYEMKKWVEKNEGEKLSHKKLKKDIGVCTSFHFLCELTYSQWALPTPEVYQKLIDRYNLKEWSGFREYEDLRREYEDLCREYEDLRPVHFLDKEHCNVWNINWISNGTNLHPCQKPIEIMERMIKTSSKPGDLVLDMFMGSGSTGVACINTGRNFIGIERDEKYFHIAEERIKKAEEEKRAV